jgi:hypothetical protein
VSKDGGPAFPTPDLYGPGGVAQVQGDSGMSLRDYFAAQALRGIATCEPDSVSGSTARTSAEDSGVRAEVAWSCYEMADAMLKAREQ